MQISLALSGGGFRASVFHLGVLARLARENHLEDVILLSTVSGGSLGAGLIYSLNGVQWPGSQVYLKHVFPKANMLIIYDFHWKIQAINFSDVFHRSNLLPCSAHFQFDFCPEGV